MLPRELQPKIIPMHDLLAMHKRISPQVENVRNHLERKFQEIENKPHLEQIEQIGCVNVLGDLKAFYNEFLNLEDQHQAMFTQIEKAQIAYDPLSKTTHALDKALKAFDEKPLDEKHDVPFIESMVSAVRKAHAPFMQEFNALPKLPISLFPLYETLLSKLSNTSAKFFELYQAAEMADRPTESHALLENAFNVLERGIRVRIKSKDIYERMIDFIRQIEGSNDKFHQLLINRSKRLLSIQKKEKEAEEKNAQGIKRMRDAIKRMPSPLPPKYEAKKQLILRSIDEYERTNSHSNFSTTIDPIFEELKNYLFSNCGPLPATAPNTPSSSPVSSQNSSPSSSPNLSSVSISAKGGIGLFNEPLTPPKLELPATNTPRSSPASSQNSSPSSSPEKGLGQFNESPTPLKLEPAAQATPIQSAPVSQNNMLMFKQPKLESAATEATPLKGSPSSEKEDATSCVDKNCNIL